MLDSQVRPRIRQTSGVAHCLVLCRAHATPLSCQSRNTDIASRCGTVTDIVARRMQRQDTTLTRVRTLARSMPNSLDLTTPIIQLGLYGPFVMRGSDNTVMLWKYVGGSQNMRDPDSLGPPDLSILGGDAETLRHWLDATCCPRYPRSFTRRDTVRVWLLHAGVTLPLRPPVRASLRRASSASSRRQGSLTRSKVGGQRQTQLLAIAN